MRSCILIVFLFVNLPAITSQNGSAYKHVQTLIEGKWYVVATNFPMWLDDKNKNPNFNYTNFRIKNDKLVFDDKVMYSKNGAAKKIEGTDKQKNTGELSFSRRGKGFLSLFKSNWKVIASDREGRWIAIYSSKTLVSPECVDILSRSKNLAEKEISDIISHLDKSYIREPIQQLK